MTAGGARARATGIRHAGTRTVRSLPGSGTVAGMEPSDLWSHRATRFHPPRWKLLVLAGASAFFAGVGYVASRSDYELLAWVGWVMLVGLGAGTLVMVARALRPGPTVIIDERGITDRTTLLPAGLIRWEQITVVRKREIGRGMGSERMLDVVLVDPGEFRSRPRSPVRRLVDRYRRAVKQPDVFIPGSMVSSPMQEVIDEIRRLRPQLQVLELPPPRARLLGRRQPDRHPRPPRW